MNAVEIEEAVSALAERPFPAAEFPFAFLEAFGNKATTIKRLRAGTSNRSDLGGVLQTNNIHIVVADRGAVTETLARLKASPATTKAKVKFVLATDGETLEAEDLESGETVACDYGDFPNHFGFFLALAGITTVRQVRESSFDIRATSRLNKLYVELLKDNPEWATERAPPRHEPLHGAADLLLLCRGHGYLPQELSACSQKPSSKMSERDSSNTHEVIGAELFRAMNTPRLPTVSRPRICRLWADTAFPYVNGGLFSGSAGRARASPAWRAPICSTSAGESTGRRSTRTSSGR